MKYLPLILLLPTLACAGTHMMRGDAAGGSLTGTYPNPTLAASAATTLEPAGVAFGSATSTPTTNVNMLAYDSSTNELVQGTDLATMAGVTSGFYGSGVRAYADPLMGNGPFVSAAGAGIISYSPFTSIIGNALTGKIGGFEHDESSGRFSMSSNRGITSLISSFFIFPVTHTSEFEVMYDSITAKTSQFAVTTGGSANKAMCWKADGITLGYCSSVVGVSGACTCN